MTPHFSTNIKHWIQTWIENDGFTARSFYNDPHDVTMQQQVRQLHELP